MQVDAVVKAAAPQSQKRATGLPFLALGDQDRYEILKPPPVARLGQSPSSGGLRDGLGAVFFFLLLMPLDG